MGKLYGCSLLTEDTAYILLQLHNAENGSNNHEHC